MFTRPRLISAAMCCLLCGEASLWAQSPPAPSAVGPNGSRVTARVLARKTWSAEDVARTKPELPPETCYSAELQLLTSASLREDLANLAEAGHTLEAFSRVEIPEALVGQTVAAELELVGSTEGVRWWMRSFHPLNP